ncbi:MAG: zf-HC2 domain-containing protein [Mariprofundaceae bacterium]
MDKLKSCKLATRLASDALERRLGFFERLRLRLHLSMCRSCNDCKKEMEILHRTLLRLQEKDAVEGGPSLSDSDKQAIRTALQETSSTSASH